MPGFGNLIGREPVASTSLENEKYWPFASVTTRAWRSIAAPACPSSVVTPCLFHHRRGFNSMAARQLRSRAATTKDAVVGEPRFGSITMTL